MTLKNLFTPFRFTVAAIFASALTVSAVTDEDPNKIEGTANPEALPAVDAEKALLSTIKYPEGMVAKVFASEPNVMDPTAIAFDEQNRLYIAETHRFDRGVEDNRRAPWTADDYALTSTAGRLEIYKKYAVCKKATSGSCRPLYPPCLPWD